MSKGYLTGNMNKEPSRQRGKDEVQDGPIPNDSSTANQVLRQDFNPKTSISTLLSVDFPPTVVHDPLQSSTMTGQSTSLMTAAETINPSPASGVLTLPSTAAVLGARVVVIEKFRTAPSRVWAAHRAAYLNWIVEDPSIYLQSAYLLAGEDIEKQFEVISSGTPNEENDIFPTNFNHICNSLDFTSSNLREVFGEFLAIKVDWQNNATSPPVLGYTVSPYFALLDYSEANITKEVMQNIAEIEGAIMGNDQAIQGYDHEGDHGNFTVRIVGVVDKDSGENKREEVDPRGEYKRGKGGSSLPHGAIAGIIVGIVFFLVIAGVIAWFLLRSRRHKNSLAAVPVKPQDTTNTYIVDKNLQAHINSSHSSDEGKRIVQRAFVEPTNTGSAFIPLVSNRRHNSVIVREHDLESSNTLQTSRVSYTVAHLVEEGMTEDDIRRLEEEERELDAEIERAGRR